MAGGSIIKYLHTTLTLLMAVSLFSGCSNERGTTYAEPLGSCDNSIKQQVTYYGDVLPFLSKSGLGQSYKCTVCHQHYAEPGGVNSVSEVNAIIRSITVGEMPTNGDKVKSKYVSMLKRWRLLNFPLGDPNQAGPSLASQANCQ